MGVMPSSIGRKIRVAATAVVALGLTATLNLPAASADDGSHGMAHWREARGSLPEGWFNTAPEPEQRSAPEPAEVPQPKEAPQVKAQAQPEAAPAAGPDTNSGNAATAGSGNLTDFGPAWADRKCPRATVTVGNSGELERALNSASAGSVIRMADGVYRDNFLINNKQGTAEKPIWLCGSRNAVIAPGNIYKDQPLTVSNSKYVALQGFSISDGLKGLTVERSSNLLIDSLAVSGTGYEAIHLMENTVSSVVSNNVVDRSGSWRPQYGEGIYIGTSSKRWNEITGGQPDRTRDIYILNNELTNVGAEAIEVKPGTSEGLIEGNSIKGQNQETNALGLIVVTGNNWTIRNNDGSGAAQNGIRLQVSGEWGTGNVVEGNTGRNNKGFGVSVHTPNGQVPRGTVIKCSNSVTGANGLLSLVSVGCTN